MRLLLISMLIFSVSAFTQEESSREPAPGVTELTVIKVKANYLGCLLYTSPSPRDLSTSRMPSSA